MDINKITRQEILELESSEYALSRKDLKKIDLSLNINPFGTSIKVLSKLKNFNTKKIAHYYPENTELIIEIASYMKVSPNQIMIGDGCDGCLEMISHTFINKEDETIIPTPTFHRYEFHTKLMGGTPIFVPMKNFELNTSEVLNKVTDKTKIIFLANPNNPTGLKIDREVKEKIIKNFKGIVVIDEALADATSINGTSLLDKYENIVIVRSFSKTFGLAALRIGYIIANQKIIEQIKKTSSPFKVNGVAQELAIEALKDINHIKKSKEYIQKNREFLISNIEKLGLKCTNSITTNFLVDVSSLYKDSTELIKKLKENNVSVTETSAFRPSKNTYIRLSVASEEENKKFIEILTKIIKNNL
ncbi:MAG: aminotransferase class I/II-fold pyridoxal phosphate-dependent enzyme [Nanoarchaeota archaeon]|nr:aminotransferase class I/II-fold pyridoxal phosphate-dependent enzyme [Nanoarchaeota archaeon]